MIIVGTEKVPTASTTPHNRWFYDFDAIDDRIRIPTVELEAGDVVQFNFIAPTNRGNIGFCSPLTGRAMFYQLDEEYVVIDADVEIDGKLIRHEDKALDDGLTHHVRITATYPNEISYIGDYFGLDYFARCPIWDFSIKTARGIHVNYPIDDGFKALATIRNSIAHGYRTNGSVDYNEATVEFLDYADEVDPKYGNIAPTMQEAILRCKEGTLGNNLDFRFGTADWEGETNSGFSVTNGVMTLNADSNTDSWTINKYFRVRPQAINYTLTVTFSCAVAGQGIEIGLFPRDSLGVSTSFQAIQANTERTVSVVIDGTNTRDLYIRNTQRDGTTPSYVQSIELRPETTRIVTEPVFYAGTSENFDTPNWYKN